MFKCSVTELSKQKKNTILELFLVNFFSQKKCFLKLRSQVNRTGLPVIYQKAIFYTKFSFSLFHLVFLVIGNEVLRTSSSREQIFTSVQDGRLNLNDSLTIEDVHLSHGLLNMHNALSTLDFDLDDALEDVHILNAVANSINEWKLRKYAKNATYNSVNKKRVKRYTKQKSSSFFE